MGRGTCARLGRAAESKKRVGWGRERWRGAHPRRDCAQDASTALRMLSPCLGCCCSGQAFH